MCESFKSAEIHYLNFTILPVVWCRDYEHEVERCRIGGEVERKARVDKVCVFD